MMVAGYLAIMVTLVSVAVIVTSVPRATILTQPSAGLLSVLLMKPWAAPSA